MTLLLLPPLLLLLALAALLALVLPLERAAVGDGKDRPPGADGKTCETHVDNDGPKWQAKRRSRGMQIKTNTRTDGTARQDDHTRRVRATTNITSRRRHVKTNARGDRKTRITLPAGRPKLGQRSED